MAENHQPTLDGVSVVWEKVLTSLHGDALEVLLWTRRRAHGKTRAARGDARRGERKSHAHAENQAGQRQGREEGDSHDGERI